MADPVANLWNGCLYPVLRNLALTALIFVVAAASGMILDSFWVFIGVMVAGSALSWWVDRRLFAERFRHEDEARNEFFGIDR